MATPRITGTDALTIASLPTPAEVDATPLPGGRTFGEVSGAEMARALLKAGVSGVSPSYGKLQNLAAYQAHIAAIAAEAGSKGVALWLEGVSHE